MKNQQIAINVNPFESLLEGSGNLSVEGVMELMARVFEDKLIRYNDLEAIIESTSNIVKRLTPQNQTEDRTESERTSLLESAKIAGFILRFNDFQQKAKQLKTLWDKEKAKEKGHKKVGFTNNNNQESALENRFPQEIWAIIFDGLPYSQILHLRQVSKEFRKIAETYLQSQPCIPLFTLDQKSNTFMSLATFPKNNDSKLETEKTIPIGLDPFLNSQENVLEYLVARQEIERKAPSFRRKILAIFLLMSILGIGGLLYAIITNKNNDNPGISFYLPAVLGSCLVVFGCPCLVVRGINRS